MLSPLRIGGATLTWNRERITLQPDSGSALELSPSGGGLRESALDRTPERALLATRSNAVLADGQARKLIEVPFGAEILQGCIGGGRSLLVGRDSAKSYDFLSGSELAVVTPGGQARIELGLPRMENGVFGVAFHDRFAVFSTESSTRIHVVQSGFPLFKPVGHFFLAGGRDLLILAAGTAFVAPVELNTNGALRHELFHAKKDLAAIPSRDHLYLVDGSAGRIHQLSVEGAILGLVVREDYVEVESGGKCSLRFDRDGRELRT